jgi:hypothetical protein
MQYKKYAVRSPLFALRDPRLSAAVLAAFSGAALRPLLPSVQPRAPRALAKGQQR